MSNLTQSQEEEQLSKILSLLEVTYSCNETEKIKIAQMELQDMSTQLPSFKSLLLKSLFLSSIKGCPIPLDLHKSVVIYLRNILLKQASDIKTEEIFDFIKDIILLYFSWEKNNNLNNETITNILGNIITFLLSVKSDEFNQPKYVDHLFSEIIKYLSPSLSQYTNEKNIFITYEKIIYMSNSLLTSKCILPENYGQLMNNYFFPIIDKILDLSKNYFNPNTNLYNDKYCSVVKIAFDCIYNVLTFIKNFPKNSLLKNITSIIIKKYWEICFKLIQINPPLDEPSMKKYLKQNPIVVLNVDINKYNIINYMKSSIIQLMCLLIQYSCSIPNDYNFLNNDDDKITDKDLISYIINMIQLTVNCLEDLLSNKEKYNLVRNYEIEALSHENSINILLYELCVFLNRTLIRQPFKDKFKNDIKLLMLNILFPLLSTNETEKNMIEKDFEMYHIYINDIIEDFKRRNFRTAGMYLITKICNYFLDENNFVLSFTLEMFNYIINEGKINNELNYNVYIENKNKYNIFDTLHNETKIDFFLLLILLLKDQINRNFLIKNHLKKLLIDNQLKLHQIQSLPIKIKLCKVYSVFIPILFREEQNLTISQNNPFLKIFNHNKQNKDIVDNNNNKFSKEYYQFVQNSIDFLLNCISQNISQNIPQNNEKNYFHSLSHSAADSISDLIMFFKNNNEDEEEETKTQKKNNEFISVSNYITKSLSNNFKIIINLILIIDNPSFYNLIDYVIEYIKAENRQDIFTCLNNITQKFVNDFEVIKQDLNKPFIMQYFKILSDFLKGVNKLDKNNQKEIEFFEEILNKIFTRVNINELDKFEYNDEVIETFEDYMNLVEFVNEKSIKIVSNILPILKKNNAFNNSYFSFLCTFMNYLPKTNNISPNEKSKLIGDIIQIIKISFSFNDDITFQSIKNALLLILKLFNIGINQLPFDILKELLILSSNSFSPISKEDIYIGNITEKLIIDQLIISNISFGLIFRPVDTFKIIFEKKNENNNNNNVINNKKEENTNNNNKDNNKENINPYLTLYFNLILTNIKISNNDYIILLNKCVILGLCSIFKEKYCLEQLNNNLKVFLLQIFVKLVQKHKNEQVDQVNRLMKKETNCNFINENENEEEEEDEDDDEDEEIEEIKDIIHDILHPNEEIKKADEYQYFCNIMNDLKNNDKDIYNILNDNFKGELERLLLVRNINITYQGKQLIVPRKTVKIIKQ